MAVTEEKKGDNLLNGNGNMELWIYGTMEDGSQW